MKLILGTLAMLVAMGCDEGATSSPTAVPGDGDAAVLPTGAQDADPGDTALNDGSSDMDATSPALGPFDADLEGDGEASIDGMAQEPLMDGGACLPIDWSASESVCSPEPLLVSSDSSDGMSVSCNQGCFLPWGCDDYDTARAQLATCPANFGYIGPAFSARGCGYLTLVSVPRDPFQGFYDPDTKQLVATFTEDDVGMVNCSGSLPMDCLYSYFGEPVLTDQEELCEGGHVADAGL